MGGISTPKICLISFCIIVLQTFGAGECMDFAAVDPRSVAALFCRWGNAVFIFTGQKINRKRIKIRASAYVPRIEFCEPCVAERGR